MHLCSTWYLNVKEMFYFNTRSARMQNAYFQLLHMRFVYVSTLFPFMRDINSLLTFISSDGDWCPEKRKPDVGGREDATGGENLCCRRTRGQESFGRWRKSVITDPCIYVFWKSLIFIHLRWLMCCNGDIYIAIIHTFSSTYFMYYSLAWYKIICIYIYINLSINLFINLHMYTCTDVYDDLF